MGRTHCLGLFVLLVAACTGGGGSGSRGISSTAPAGVTIRSAYAYQVTIDGGNGAVSYALTSAPTGMTVSATGLVQWTPAYADLGTHAVTLTATDADGPLVQNWTVRVDQGIAMGVALSPRGHSTGSTLQDWTDHYGQHAPWGEAISFHGMWRDAPTDDGQIPTLARAAMEAALQYGFTPIVGLGWSDGDGNPNLTSESEPGNNSWSNSETRAEFLAMVTAFAQTYRPPFLFLGNEVNAWALTHTPTEWADWLSEFEACYDAIKAVSPTTVVYTTFQFEKLEGLGARNGWSDPPQWHLLTDHVTSGKIDAIGFTSYPYFEYDTPGAIPAGYYDEIAAHWTGAVIFSEIGWLAAPTFPYPGSEADQAAFVARFFALTDDLDLRDVTWLFLHDWDGQATLPAFANIGLRSNDGSAVRAADGAWQGEVLLRQR